MAHYEAHASHATHEQARAQREDHDHNEHANHAALMRDRFYISSALSIPLLVYSPAIQNWFGFTPPEFPGSVAIPAVFGTIIFVVGGILFLQMARHELKRRQPGMMTLISLAISAAFTYSLALAIFAPEQEGFFWELATLIDVMLLGHWMEMRSVGQAQGALKALAKLLPDEAERILPSGETETVPANRLQPGDRVLIRPGASIPADALVIEGESHVNESMITGESRPVIKRVGDALIGGAVNQSGSLRAEITHVGDETALAGIMRLVADAQASKSRAQTLAQRAAFWLTIIAIAAGFFTLNGWLLFGGGVGLAIQRTITVLVIACPHALGLAIPLVTSISTTLSARNGLLVRDRLALESAKDLDIIIFDKTGTLTKGEQSIVALAASGISEDEALGIAAAIEGDSEHIIARAIREKAHERGLHLPQLTAFESLAGRGVKASIDGKIYHVGGPRLLEQQEWTVPTDLQAAKDRAESAGQTVVYLADEAGVRAAFVLADTIREESYAAVRELHSLDLKVAMLTGDSQAVARAVAEELKIDAYFAEVLPEHKAAKVKELQQGGSRVAMVGDGVNDAPALATADVGIAIGAGTDVAIESAGIILVRSDPGDIAKIIRLSQATYRKMQQNLVWATGYNVIAIPLAMGILAPVGFLLPPAIGAAFMSASTVIVALNAQLLRRVRLA